MIDERALLDLLPAVHRIRDADAGALEALLAVLGEQAAVVEQDVDRLYDNWFVETCDPWVVPYIGDLLGVRPMPVMEPPEDPLAPSPPRPFGARGYVANTIAYRRRKGTAAVLEQLALDVTGWRARVVELFRLLGTTQYANHVRLDNVRTPDLRRSADLALTGGPFERVSRTADVRSVEPLRPGDRPGRPNIPAIALFLWRLQDYPVRGGRARHTAAGFTFDPLGRDVPLFNTPRSETTITHLAEEVDVPAPLRRRALYDELERRRRALAAGEEVEPVWFGEDPPLRVLLAAADGSFAPVPPERMLVCDLSAWTPPPGATTYPGAGGATVGFPVEVAVDPELGRIAFPAGVDPAEVRVDYAYGFGGDVGGGPYDRSAGLDAVAGSTSGVTLHVGVTTDPRIVAGASDPALLVPTLREAIDRWTAHVAARPAGSPPPFGLITIMDGDTYEENLAGDAVVAVPEGARLVLAAAGWPDLADPSAPGGRRRRDGAIVPAEPLRPHLRGRISVRGTAPGSSDSPGEFVVSGLLIEDGVTVLPGNLGRLALVDATIPPSAGVTVKAAGSAARRNAMLGVTIARSITGPVALPETVARLTLAHAIADAGEGVAIEAPGAALSLRRSTVFGTARARTVEISNSILTGGAHAAIVQEGCVRYSALPRHPASRVPRRFRCQPDLGLEGVAAADVPRRTAELTPGFTSRTLGDPGYAQLARGCPPEIAEGAEDGSEMGAFGFLRQSQRRASLRACLDEYLPFGMRAGILDVT
ncbi:MAG TPA: hypothetical protein VGB83_06475 [Actinomycetota bacterium]